MSTQKEALISHVSYIFSVSFSQGFGACWSNQGPQLQVTEVSIGWKDTWRLMELIGQLKNYLGKYTETIGRRWQASENTTMSHHRGSVNLTSLYSSTTGSTQARHLYIITQIQNPTLEHPVDVTSDMYPHFQSLRMGRHWILQCL